MPSKRVLILGGTREAVEIANVLAGDDDLEIISSLAGRTSTPSLPDGITRIGGFGGETGLALFLNTEKIDLFLDVTHPYAVHMSRNAQAAANVADVACLRFERPAWPVRDNWRMVRNTEGAAAAVPANGRVLLTIGRQEVAAFYHRSDVTFHARMIEPPTDNPPQNVEVILDRPPYTLESERELLASNRITHLVTKNAGGGAVDAKLDAAEELGVAVVMIDRPHDRPKADAGTVSKFLALARSHLA